MASNDTRLLSRRQILRYGLTGAALTTLAACQPKVVMQTVVVEKEVEKVVQQTVVVEKEVEKKVEVTKEVIKIATAAPSEVIEIRFQDGIQPADEGNALKLFEQFHEKNPKIKIKNEPNPDGWPDKTLTMMAAGTAPDIHLGYGDPMYLFVSRGMFMDLQPKIDSDLKAEQVDDYVKAQYDFFQFGKPGKRFALPKYCGTSAYLYNKGMFEEAGLPLPDNTWDWLTTLEVAQKLTKLDDKGKPLTFGLDIADLHHLGYVLACFIWTWGGEVHKPGDNSVCMMDGTEALEALQFAQDLRFKYKVNGMPSDYDAMKTIGWGLIGTGKVAMHRGGSWHIPMALQSCDFAFDCMENPLAPGGKHRETFLTTDGYGIWVGTKHPDEAWQVLKFLSVSGEWNKHLITSSWPLQPAKRSLVKDWIDHLKKNNARIANADIEAFTRSFEYARPQVSFCDNPAALEIINPVLDEIYKLGKVQAKEAIPPLVKQVNELLKSKCPDGGW